MDRQFRYQTEADLKEKAVKATRLFLERQNGLDVIETGFQTIAGGIDVVAKDDLGTLHLTWVRVAKIGLPKPVEDYDELRKFFEQRAIAWLDAHPETVDCMIEFDVADLGVFGNERALLRYHHNVLSRPSSELRELAEMHAASLPDDDRDDGENADEDVA